MCRLVDKIIKADWARCHCYHIWNKIRIPNINEYQNKVKLQKISTSKLHISKAYMNLVRQDGLRLPELTLREGYGEEERERDLDGLETEREEDLELDRDDDLETKENDGHGFEDFFFFLM
ncbi:hypothetical protein YC2023_079711 [Brassica napus]